MFLYDFEKRNTFKTKWQGDFNTNLMKKGMDSSLLAVSVRPQSWHMHD
jgi:hypothetical protein